MAENTDDILLGPSAPLHARLVRAVAGVRTALWAWDYEGALELAQGAIEEQSDERAKAISEARWTARKYDRRRAAPQPDAEQDVLDGGGDEYAGGGAPRPPLDPEDVAPYLLSGPVLILDAVRKRMVEESVPLSPTVGDLRYNAAVHDDGRIELRGYSLSGAPFEMGRLLVGLREAFGPSIEIARGEDEPPEEDDSSEFSSSVRFLFSGLVLEGEGPGEVVSSGFVTVSIQRDLVQAFYDRTNTNAPAEPVIGRLAAATAKSVV